MNNKRLEIVTVDRTDGKALIEFSDATVAVYSARELAKLKPARKVPRPMPIRRRRFSRSAPDPTPEK